MNIQSFVKICLVNLAFFLFLPNCCPTPSLSPIDMFSVLFYHIFSFFRYSIWLYTILVLVQYCKNRGSMSLWLINKTYISESLHCSSVLQRFASPYFSYTNFIWLHIKHLGFVLSEWYNSNQHLRIIWILICLVKLLFLRLYLWILSIVYIPSFFSNDKPQFHSLIFPSSW